MVRTCAEAIREAVAELGGVVSTGEIVSYINEKYPERWKETTIRTCIIGCSINHPSSRHYPCLPKFLFTVGRGRVRLYDPERDGKWVVGPEGPRRIEEVEEEREALEEAAVGLERDLESFIFGNLCAIQEGLRPYRGEAGRQYPVKSGRIDILAQDKEGNLVVVEVKAGTATDSALAQVLAYMADVSREVAKGRKVKGVIVAYDFTDRLVSAASLLPDLRLMKYKVSFEFGEVAK